MLLHVDVFVSSMSRMLDFYVDKMGMSVIDDSELSGGLVNYVSENTYDAYRVVLLRISNIGSMLELIQYTGKPRENADVGPHPVTIALLVTSLDNQLERLSQKGIERSSEIFEVRFPHAGKSRIAFIEDPENNKIELLQMLFTDSQSPPDSPEK